MTNKTTKSALLMSALALLLCIAMLTGTTFAWFTDEVNSGVNKIVAGNLDVDVYYGDPAEKKSINGVSTLFNDVTLWEPGAVAYENLTVANLGTLALKYQLSVNFDNENTVNGYGLSTALKVAVVAGGFDGNRDDAMNLAGTSLADFVLPGDLLDGESDVYGIVIWWEPSADDNNWNVNNGKVTSDEEPYLHIDLGIKLVATQLSSEEDSFDEYYDGVTPWFGDIDTAWYDADPSATVFEIGTAEELAGLAQIVNSGKDYFEGKTIKLVSNLNLNNINWTPIGSAVKDHGFMGNFDGNGKTIFNLAISNIQLDADGYAYAGLFGVTEGVAGNENTIKDLKIENVIINTKGHIVAAAIAYPYYTTVSNITVCGNVVIAGGMYTSGVLAYTRRCTTASNLTISGNEGSSVQGTITVGGVISDIQTNGGIVANYTNFSASGLTVRGDKSVGGISGIIGRQTLNGATVKDVTLVCSDPHVGIVSGSFDGHPVINNVSISNVKGATSVVGAPYNGEESNGFVTIDGVEYAGNSNAFKEQLAAGTVNLACDIAIAKNETITVANGATAVINLNGNKISSTADKTGNQELFLVKGNLTVKNGSMEYVASNNQAWNAMIAIFDITAGGELTLDGVKASVSGSDMNFIAHLNNWGSATLNVNDCDFTSTYVAIRAFNSGNDMNNIVVKDTAFHGGRVFWVHNYTSEGKDDSTLNVRIYNNGNTTDNLKPVRYGFDVSTFYTLAGDEIASVDTQDALNSAVANGQSEIVLSDGNYSMPGTSSDVTISGTKDTVVTVTGTPSGSDVTFNGVTVKGSGYATGVNAATVTYNNATIVGDMCLYREKVVFNNCTFELNNQYIWTYGAKEVEFNNCTFNTNGKAILVYNEGAGASKVTVKGCTFNATAGAKAGDIANQNCAAIEINNYQSSGTGVAHTVITEGNTFNSNFSGEWRIKNFVAGNAITVNGTAYTQIAVDGKLMTIDASKNVTVLG